MRQSKIVFLNPAMGDLNNDIVIFTTSQVAVAPKPRGMSWSTARSIPCSTMSLYGSGRHGHNRINFKLAGTSSAGEIQTTIQILETASRKVAFSLTNELEGNKRYFIEHNLPHGDYLVNFSLEGVFAHESQIALS